MLFFYGELFISGGLFFVSKFVFGSVLFRKFLGFAEWLLSCNFSILKYGVTCPVNGSSGGRVGFF